MKIFENNLFVNDYTIERAKADARAQLALELYDLLTEIENVRNVDKRS